MHPASARVDPTGLIRPGWIRPGLIRDEPAFVGRPTTILPNYQVEPRATDLGWRHIPVRRD